MKTIKLQKVGRNFWGYMAYKDEQGHFFLDINNSLEKKPTELCSCHPAEDMNGEPGYRVVGHFDIINPITDKEIREDDCRGLYMKLSQIYYDLIAFLGKTGNEEEDCKDFRYKNHKYGLWENSVEETLKEIKKRWNIIPSDLKPEWCTWRDIEVLEKKSKKYLLQ